MTKQYTTKGTSNCSSYCEDRQALRI